MYVNEHKLVLLLVLLKNWYPECEPNEHRARLEEELKVYDSLLETKKKNTSEVQKQVKLLISIAKEATPKKKDIDDLYESVLAISKRVVNMWAKTWDFDPHEIAAESYNRLSKYRLNFDVDKPSTKLEADGTPKMERVNAFAYVTQVIKKVIYGEINRKQIEHQRYEPLDDNDKDIVILESKEFESTVEHDITRIIAKKLETCIDIRQLLFHVSKDSGYPIEDVVGVVSKLHLQEFINNKIKNNLLW